MRPFIVDNSTSQAGVLQQLSDMCVLAEQLDVATGHFEIGGLLALAGVWQRVQKVRILIGGETSAQTVNAVKMAFEGSFDLERAGANPLLEGVDAIVNALSSGQIEIRVYTERKFHAKAYIARRTTEGGTRTALVGSSNFTRPGLSQNVELNVNFTESMRYEEDQSTVESLIRWFDEHWKDADPVTSELLHTIKHHIRQILPYEVYAKALETITRDVQPSGLEWETRESKIFRELAPYQKEAYYGLRHMARQWKGGFLTDGVGLGKTFVGLMLAEYFAVKERLNVVIFASKTGKEAVWEPEIARRLPDLTGPFSRLMVAAFTDLSKKDGPQTAAMLAERADVIIIDEAHNFRNHGKKGDDETSPRSRWWRMQQICEGKTVFMLTATPINNALDDLLHQVELFTSLDRAYFQSLGISDIQRYLYDLQRPFMELASGKSKSTEISLRDFEELLRQDRFLESIIYQNSRKYAVESSKRAGVNVEFPTMEPPRAVRYEFANEQQKLLKELEAAFEKDDPLFVLPMYYPLAFSTSSEIDTKLENRQRQVVALIRTVFLKRFESSVAAFAGSCLDLSYKILDWLALNTSSNQSAADQLSRWRDRNDDLLTVVHETFRPNAEEHEDASYDDLTPEEFDEIEKYCNPNDYDLPKMLDAAFEDLNQLQRFLERIASGGRTVDGKYQKLLTLLAGSSPADEVFTPEFREQKVLIFTEFADTARYLHERLTEDRVLLVDRLDGSRKADRVKMIRRFAPFYNAVSDADREELSPLRVLVSTDVLSEGVNLQDGTLVVNYDLHWNPVRLIQRIGRVDRRLNRETESRLIAANPSTKESRGRIQVRNFLPPTDLDVLLKLYRRVEARVLLISKTLGIPGGKLLTEDDMLDDTRVFNAFRHEYEGDLSALEHLRLKFIRMVEQDPSLEPVLASLPSGAVAAKQSRSTGMFTCELYPTQVKGDDGMPDVWTMDVAQPRWRFCRWNGDEILDLLEIDALIESDSATGLADFSDRTKVVNWLSSARRDDLQNFRKSVQLPIDAPTPRLVCWMENVE
jgi:SNF2 family DNA or RNA helicase